MPSMDERAPALVVGMCERCGHVQVVVWIIGDRQSLRVGCCENGELRPVFVLGCAQ
jgi:hypothetical protein